MGQALYRTHRSRSLSEVVGQEHITDTLARAIKAGRISHAYLLTGPRGTGKTSIARILAHEINDLPYTGEQYLDIIEIDAASNRRIDDIRDLRDKVNIAPVNAKYKVYIIDEVHMLTGESFNALLKTLEEPPSHVVFILATTEVHKLPATILSRTQRYSFRLGKKETMVTYLKDICKKENIQIDDDALELIAENGGGSYRDTLSLLDQLRHVSEDKITLGDVTSTLGLAPKAQLDALIKAALTGDHAAIAKVLTELEMQGGAVSAIVNQLSRELAAQATGNPDLYRLIDALLDVPHAYNPSLKLLTTLVQFAHKPTPVRAEPKTVATAATAEPVMSIVATPKAKTIEVEKVVEPVKLVSAAASQSLGALSPEDWQAILHTVKKAHAPLFAVLKHAQPVFKGETLTLKFKFALHSKKLDDAKQKSLISQVIQETLGGTPVIMTAVDKTAMPPVLSSDPTLTSVANIMGGGEVIDAKAI